MSDQKIVHTVWSPFHEILDHEHTVYGGEDLEEARGSVSKRDYDMSILTSCVFYYVQLLYISNTSVKLLQILCWGKEVINNKSIEYDSIYLKFSSSKPMFASYGRVEDQELLGRGMREHFEVTVPFYIFIRFDLYSSCIVSSSIDKLKNCRFYLFLLFFSKRT